MAEEAEQEFSTPYEKGTGYEKTTVVELKAQDYAQIAPASLSSNHFIASIVLLIVSFINPIVLLLCALPAVFFSVKARNACQQGDKEAMRENDKTSFGFIIFGIITWIVTICVAGFTAHAVRCGLSGMDCDTRIQY